MGQKRQSSKRPCRICKKWFVPSPRLGDRQKTCGDSECQRQWHKRKCAEWNRKNRFISRENYLRNRLNAVASPEPPQSPSPSPSLPPKPPPQHTSPLYYPRDVVQEVIGVQQLVIIEYIVRLLQRGVQEVIRPQHAELNKAWVFKH